MHKDLITRAVLEKLAGATTFRRGEEYFSAGAVARLRVAGDKITASVKGTEIHRVDLRNDDGKLDGDCTGPNAADGNFCKHCVAVGLAWLAKNSSAPKSATDHAAFA